MEVSLMPQNSQLRYLNAELNVSSQASCLTTVRWDFWVQSSMYRVKPRASERSTDISDRIAQCREVCCMSQNGPLRFPNAEFNVSRQALCLKTVHWDFWLQSSMYWGKPHSSKRSSEISECRIQCIETGLMPQNVPLRFLNAQLNVSRQASCRKTGHWFSG